AVNQLHREEPGGSFTKQLVQIDQVWVSHVDERPEFSLEAIHKLLTPQHLERDDALLLAIVGFVDRPKPANAQPCPEVEARSAVVILANGFEIEGSFTIDVCSCKSIGGTVGDRTKRPAGAVVVLNEIKAVGSERLVGELSFEQGEPRGGTELQSARQQRFQLLPLIFIQVKRADAPPSRAGADVAIGGVILVAQRKQVSQSGE